MLSVQSISFLLAAIITAALGFGMLIRGAKNRLYLSFSVLSGVLFLFYLTNFVHRVSEEAVWFRFAMLAALAVPPTAIRFFNIFLGLKKGFSEQASRIALTGALLLVPFIFSALINNYAVKVALLGFVFAALLFCLFMIFNRLRRTTSRVESARLKYLLYGGMVAVFFSLIDYMPNIEVPWFQAVGNTLTVVYLYFLSQIIIRFRLLDLNELVGKMLVLATLVTLLAIVYTLVGQFVSEISGLIFFNTFIAGFVILILFDPINRLVEDKVNRLLFRERYEFGRQLALLRRELANVVDVAQMSQLILTRLENSRRVTCASVYLLEEDGSALRCLGYVGTPPVQKLDSVAERLFLDRLKNAEFYLMESAEAEIQQIMASSDESKLAESDALQEIQRVLRALETDLCIALISEGHVIGLLNVRDDRVRESYSPEEIANLVSIASQATICVENSRIVSHLRDRDRLAALGEMAAGLAHEVRNPLGAIKGAAQMLGDVGPEGDNGSGEFLEIIIEEVNRLNKVVSAFLDYAKPYRGTAGPADVNQVIDRVTTLLRNSAKEAGVVLKVELENHLPPAHIDPEVLRQVIWNLGLNALEAMTGHTNGGRPREVSILTRSVANLSPLSSTHFGQEGVDISVTDTGPGISPADLERIFIPFYTTKEKGTGLGLAICQRLVRAAGGEIGVSSERGEGTTFSVRLPLWTAEAVSVSAERKRVALG